MMRSGSCSSAAVWRRTTSRHARESRSGFPDAAADRSRTALRSSALGDGQDARSDRRQLCGDRSRQHPGLVLSHRGGRRHTIGPPGDRQRSGYPDVQSPGGGSGGPAGMAANANTPVTCGSTGSLRNPAQRCRHRLLKRRHRRCRSWRAGPLRRRRSWRWRPAWRSRLCHRPEAGKRREGSTSWCRSAATTVAAVDNASGNDDQCGDAREMRRCQGQDCRWHPRRWWQSARPLPAGRRMRPAGVVVVGRREGR
jgi:hypothetical protein